MFEDRSDKHLRQDIRDCAQAYRDLDAMTRNYERAQRALRGFMEYFEGESWCPLCHNEAKDGVIIHEVDCPQELAKNYPTG